MSKRQRLKKEARVIMSKQDQLAIAQRRKERLAPLNSFIKRLTLTLVGTALLLVAGVLVNNHLVQILNNLK